MGFGECVFAARGKKGKVYVGYQPPDYSGVFVKKQFKTTKYGN
jgi:hypothetical protein